MRRLFAGTTTIAVLLLVLYTEESYPVSAPTKSNATRIPLYFLLLLPIPNDREDTGWGEGPSVLAGARVARNEVNEKAGFLEGYRLELIESGHEACGIRRTSQGLTNFVDNAVNPGSGHLQPVVAVGGLLCSGITETVSALAGRPEVAILQLSGSNSPIFDRANMTHPYLWKFLVSASIFKNVIISLLDEYDWNKIFLVYDGGSLYFSGIANEFKQAIAGSSTKQIIAEDIVLSNEAIYYDQLVKDIKDTRAKVIIAITSQYQSEKLACIAKLEGLTYPNYQWVYINDLTSMSLTDVDCSKANMMMEMEHAIIANLRMYQEPSTRLFSGLTYREYRIMYNIELEKIKLENNAEYASDALHGGIIYDQVWALSLALNSTIHLLKQRNVSIEQYGFGQSSVTDLLHEEMSTVSFVGASTNISFMEKREVFNSVDIYYVNRTGKSLVGTYNGTTLTLQVNLSGEVVDDDWNPPPSTLPASATALLFTADILVIVFVTVVLVIFVLLRNKPEIKATSPLLSCLLFIGCYMLCFAALCNIANIGFILEEVQFLTFCNLRFILAINGVLLIFGTLLIRLLRIDRIFNNKRLANMHELVWSNWFLSGMVFVLCAIPNIVLVLWLCENPLEYNSTVHLSLIEGVLTAEKTVACTGKNIELWFGLFLGLVAVIAAGILFLAFRTRKVRYKNFKDTKKVNIFCALLIVVSTFSITLGSILQSVEVYFAVLDISIIVGLMLLVPVLCQLLLFVPKITPSQCICLAAIWRTFLTCKMLRHASLLQIEDKR